ncbi:malto-oligosyltrehalose synthase [Wenxinia marina]|uniref:Maltooligosyl trehalose synthase n=1 Tax=Wenxinia marina DSM 24838 TaxID=1123501 RepID=A0A0D0PFA5_9RHOB|nr:malto-oligosyltrehalose synthase [Wenxinia marina]KIQ70041.1 maltooligosyl trehalose synthase [Wenxinia marina DSM 24838]GGL63060.1 malto-oligosyltrehalose synthase [Wenxinia marina]
MTLPTACYRLQFRGGMDFDRAATLAPYLARLGISHLYASPLFTAQSGSTHGYDVTDQGEVDPALGGRAGLERLSAALKAEGLGLVLDIVPNHMAFSVETPWLRDVLRRGPDSRYARHFDLDPEEERIRLPWLTAPFEDVLADGKLAVEDDEEGPVLVIDGGLRVPLAAGAEIDGARGGDAGALRALHAAQPWRLVHWRTESDALSHRRFFNVTGLIGVRVEDEAVFEDVHRLTFDLVDSGIVDGIRIDHIDGLADPAGYLARLRGRLPDTPIWVEKILSGPETLPRDWPIEGTTGYVAARAFSRLLTDADGLDAVDDAYRAATGRTDPVEDVLHRARRQIMTHDLAAELWTLQRQLAAIAADDPVGCELGPETLREALLAFIAAFPRYRTYMTDGEVSQADAALVRRTAAEAAARLTDPGALPFLAEVLTRPTKETAAFRLRLQQVTGAAVAKSQEDTAFYREVRLLSANEVGSEPDDDSLGIDGFHRAMSRRAERMPHGLTLTSSHDTKRSEDARMRIAAITRAPEAFGAWFRICRGFAPERLNPNLVWYVAQTFLALDQSDGDMGDRLADHVVKALREAKSETFWTAPDLELEEAAQTYVRRLAQHFPRHAMEVTPILRIADRLSLIQTALKLTVPGIPDIYQGCEFAAYALTDPDNRREVDFGARARALEGEAPARPLDAAKFELTRTLLRLRRERPALFLSGGYHPIEAPAGVCAFARREGGASLNVALAIDADSGALAGAVPGGSPVWPEAPSDAPVRITLNGV